MKKKHSFGFLYKYLFLAAALMAVLCFSFVFARYTTGTTETVTADIEGFSVSSYVYEDMVKDENGYEVYYEKEHASGVVVGEGETKDVFNMVLLVVNESAFPVSCEIEMGWGYMITAATAHRGVINADDDGIYEFKDLSDPVNVVYTDNGTITYPDGAVAVTETDETSKIVGVKSVPMGNAAAYGEDGGVPFLAFIFTVGMDPVEYVEPCHGDEGHSVMMGNPTSEWSYRPDLDTPDSEDYGVQYFWFEDQGYVVGDEGDSYHGLWYSFDFTVYYAQAE